MIETAMILAAGLGTRMRPLTLTTPKPLLPVKGRSLLDHALDRAREAGARRAVVNIHAFPDQMRAALAARSDVEILISDESGLLLETGGGLVKALPLLGNGPVLVLNADNIWTGAAPGAALLKAWDEARMDALLLLAPLENVRAYARAGDFSLDDASRLIRRGAAPRAPYVFTGAQILHPRLLEGAPAGPFSLNWAYDKAIAAGRAFGAIHDGLWADVGTPAGLAAAESALDEAGA